MSLYEPALLARLRKRYPPESWALFAGVPSGTGAAAGRTADALALSLWPSRGLELHGFELKTSRTDWRRELRNPAKAEAVCRFCDRWWVVAGNEDAVPAEELPPTWGLLVAKGEGLRLAKEAPKLEAQPMTRSFLAALLRKAQKDRPGDQELEAARKAASDEAYARGTADAERKAARLAGNAGERAAVLGAFEEAAGRNLYSVDEGRRVGERVARILASEDTLERAGGRIRWTIEQLRHTLDELEELAAGPPAAHDGQTG